VEHRTISFEVSGSAAARRLDVAVCERVTSLSRSQARRLILAGLTTVNGRAAKPHRTVRQGDRVTVTLPPPEPSEALPEEIPLNIVYEDDALLVVDKPAGMVVHPAAGVRRGTLVNALLHHCPNLSTVGGTLRPGIVHRLDKGTSGLLMVAKDDQTHRRLAAQLKARQVKRGYTALVMGRLKEDAGQIEHAIGRHVSDRKRMSVVTRKGRAAVTTYRVVERFMDYTLIELRLGTGRTHQIRVHMSTLGHPVAGDRTYGGKTRSDHGSREVEERLRRLSRLALHAHLLGFTHPASGEPLEFVSPLPSALQEIIAVLRPESAPTPSTQQGKHPA